MKINTCIVGFGDVAAQNIKDSVTLKNYRYSTHLQAMLKIKKINLEIIFDPSKKTRNIARQMTGISNIFSSIEKAKDNLKNIDLVILTTPPHRRLGFLDKFPNLKSLIVEKPIGVNLESSKDFFREVKKKKLLCSVNYWRRYVKQFQKLKNGLAQKLIGKIQSVIIIYGNGIRNNGIHLIDFLRFVCGDIKIIKTNFGTLCKESPIKDDFNINFSGVLNSGVSFSSLTVDFKNFRENGLIFFGERGTISILNDCRTMFLNKIRKNRGISNFNEIDFTKNNFIDVDYDLAMLNLYKEISQKKNKNSTIENALINEEIVEDLVKDLK